MFCSQMRGKVEPDRSRVSIVQLPYGFIGWIGSCPSEKRLYGKGRNLAVGECSGNPVGSLRNMAHKVAFDAIPLYE